MQAARRHTGIYYFLIGMLIPIILAGIGFILIGIWPFGDGTVLIIDSLHQYLPFYTDFHEKLRSGEGLLYSFSAGFGYNFWAILPTRALQFAAMTPVYCVLVCCLYFSPVTSFLRRHVVTYRPAEKAGSVKSMASA